MDPVQIVDRFKKKQASKNHVYSVGEEVEALLRFDIVPIGGRGRVVAVEAGFIESGLTQR